MININNEDQQKTENEYWNEIIEAMEENPLASYREILYITLISDNKENYNE